jgi:hypothetical protein
MFNLSKGTNNHVTGLTMANWHVNNPKRHANNNHNNIMTHQHATLQKNSRPNSRKHGKKLIGTTVEYSVIIVI